MEQLPLKLKRLPPFIIEENDCNRILYRLFLTPCSYNGKAGWELMYLDPYTHNKFLSITQGGIQECIDRTIQYFKENCPELLKEIDYEREREKRARRKTKRAVPR